MLFYETTPITPKLEQRISDLARSLERGHIGRSRVSRDSAITFLYDKSSESTELSREWLTTVRPKVQHTIPSMKLRDPERRPVLLCQEKGGLVISRGDEGVIIPVRARSGASVEEIIDIKTGHSHANAKLKLDTIIIVSGGDEDVQVTMPLHVPYKLILHPKQPTIPPKESII